MARIIFFVGFLGLMFGLVSDPLSWASDVPEHRRKGDHFIAVYSDGVSDEWVRSVLAAADRYYDQIARQIGYARVQSFWTWDNRVEIVIYPDKETFHRSTGQPPWSKGGVKRDRDLIHSKRIMTFVQEEGFLNGVLPHEIGHLILWDFVGFETSLPLWFEEGVAQFFEERDDHQVDRMMSVLAAQGKLISLSALMSLNIQQESEPDSVAVFYVQSASIAGFLITHYGSTPFGEMCSALRRGKSFEDALSGAYRPYISSLAELERKWIQSLNQGIN